MSSKDTVPITWNGGFGDIADPVSQVPLSNSNRLELDLELDNGTLGISFSIGDLSLIGMYWYETALVLLCPEGQLTFSA